MQDNDESEEVPSRKELLQNIADLQERLERRNILLSVITKAYHRDTVYNDVNQGSLDLRPYLSVFAPHDSKLFFRPCNKCGGTAELVCREDKRVKELSKKLEHTNEQWRSQIKDISCTLSTEREHYKNEKSRFAVEKKQIQKDMEDLKTCSQYLLEDFRSRYHHLENIRAITQRNFQVSENSNRLYIVDNSCLGMFANELEQVLSYQSTAYDQIQAKHRNVLNRNENVMKREKEAETKFDIAKKNLLHAQDEIKLFQRNVLKTNKMLEQVRQKLEISEEDKQRLKRKYDRTILQMEQSQSGLNNDIEEIRKELYDSRDQLKLAREQIKNLSLINSKHDELILKNNEEVVELAKLKIEKERVDIFCENVCAFIWELVSRFENITSVIHKKLSPMSTISTLKFSRRTKESSDLLSKDFQGRKLSIVKNIDLCCSDIIKTVDAGVKELSSDCSKEIETLKKENDSKTKDLIKEMRKEKEKFEIILDKERMQSSKYEDVCERLRKENQCSESELQILKTKILVSQKETEKAKEHIHIAKVELERVSIELEQKNQKMIVEKENLERYRNLTEEQAKQIQDMNFRLQKIQCEMENERNERIKMVEENERRIQTNEDYGAQHYPETNDVSVGIDLIVCSSALESPAPWCNTVNRPRPSSRVISSKSPLKKSLIKAQNITM